MLLTGCNTFQTTPVNNEVTITWVRYNSEAAVDEKCKSLSKSTSTYRTILGCAVPNLKAKTCTIYTVNPRGLDDRHTCTLGHETKHCFDGAYHE